jgi:hypothetical protein
MTSNELNEMQLEHVVAGMSKPSSGKTATSKQSTTNTVTKTLTTS